MRPYPEEVLRAVQGGVMAHFAPELQSNYAKAQLAFAMLLFSIAQRDADSAVADLVASNARLRALLNDAAAAMAEIERADCATTREALGSLPAAADSLRLSALRSEHEGLRAVISQIAPVLEATHDDPQLAALKPARDAIYAYLSEDARKRIVPILTAG